ncbi:hypothetical protein [Gynuella sunshinyii]|uniref:Porin domain-containing protein n=1 Tax=Gynuella sunshinyii YC6258 TaxID=1445510 RepID=A0A0C5VDM9_9GAMM|nr:hypothetical protein [Gynuella sunshinyii]AJQ97435.1 hypothetical Protein YC6258_05405 [Gynuella sunshinyii YC6258]
MKAIKIASGFAVTALAAAITGQAAAADTETSYTFYGTMSAGAVFDFKGDDTRDVDTLESDNGDNDIDEGDFYGLMMDLDVVHGPFSANISIDGIKTAGDQTAEVTVNDIIVTDGPISFGQVGEVTVTDEYIGVEELDMDDGNDFEPDVGIRYSANGLSIQLEGADDDSTDAETADDVIDFGVGVNYHYEMDALKLDVEGQYLDNGNQGGETTSSTFVGLAATYDLGKVAIKAAINNTAGDGEIAVTKTIDDVDVTLFDFTEVAVQVDVNITDTISAYVAALSSTGTVKADGVNVLEDIDTADIDGYNPVEVEVGASAGFGSITVSGYYYMDNWDDSGDILYGKLAYAQDAYAAYADVEVDDLDAEEIDSPAIGLGVSYTSEVGVVYAADYDYQSKKEKADVSTTNKIELSASYSF